MPGCIVAELRDVLTADHQDALHASLTNPVVRDGHTGEHSCAGVREVERHRLVGSDRMRHSATHRGFHLLRQAVTKFRDAAADYRVERSGLALCPV
jgi:hypothetical protein